MQVSVTPESTTAERIDQYLLMVQQDEKQALLGLILQGRYNVPGKIERVLVFTRTKHGADRVVKKLDQQGIPANAIHGNKSQPQRQRALDEFRRGATPVLVATDVAARGIDIPGVSHVINYELPNVPEQYVHRIGRTARAGADGVAIAFCAEDERAYLKDIRKQTDAEFERLPLPENFREVVEGVGPTKPEVRGQRQRVKAKPRVQGQGHGRGQGQGQARGQGEGGKPAHKRRGPPKNRPNSNTNGEARGNRGPNRKRRARPQS